MYLIDMPIPVPFLVGMVELSGVECAGELILYPRARTKGVQGTLIQVT